MVEIIAILLKSDGIELKPYSVAFPDNNPAMIAPNEDAKNHTPIICPIYLLGDNVEIADKPIGLIVNSPIV